MEGDIKNDQWGSVPIRWSPELRSLALLQIWLCCLWHCSNTSHQSASASGSCPCRRRRDLAGTATWTLAGSHDSHGFNLALGGGSWQYFTDKCAPISLIVGVAIRWNCLLSIRDCWRLRRRDQIAFKCRDSFFQHPFMHKEVKLLLSEIDFQF